MIDRLALDQTNARRKIVRDFGDDFRVRRSSVEALRILEGVPPRKGEVKPAMDQL